MSALRYKEHEKLSTCEGLLAENDMRMGSHSERPRIHAVRDPVVEGKAQFGQHSPQNGILGDARRSTAELGKRAFDVKVDYAVRQIRSFLPTS